MYASAVCENSEAETSDMACPQLTSCFAHANLLRADDTEWQTCRYSPVLVPACPIHVDKDGDSNIEKTGVFF